jgi:hypothetical protein
MPVPVKQEFVPMTTTTEYVNVGPHGVLVDGYGECMHSLDPVTCGVCMEAVRKRAVGRLFQRPYVDHLRDMAPEAVAEIDEKPVRKCSRCKSRGATNGNRVYVRHPRTPDGLLAPQFGTGFAGGDPRQDLPPSWEGPLSEKPRIRDASHCCDGNNVHQWLCDRCCNRKCHYFLTAPMVFVGEEEEKPNKSRSSHSVFPITALFGSTAEKVYGSALQGLESTLRD